MWPPLFPSLPKIQFPIGLESCIHNTLTWYCLQEKLSLVGWCTTFFCECFTNCRYGWHKSWIAVLCQYKGIMLIHFYVDNSNLSKLCHAQFLFWWSVILLVQENFRNELIHQCNFSNVGRINSKWLSIFSYFWNVKRTKLVWYCGASAGRLASPVTLLTGDWLLGGITCECCNWDMR